MGKIFELKGETLHTLFPGHLVVDRQGTIISVGESIKDFLAPSDQLYFTKIFALQQMDGSVLQFSDLATMQNESICLLHRVSKVKKKFLCHFNFTSDHILLNYFPEEAPILGNQEDSLVPEPGKLSQEDYEELKDQLELTKARFEKIVDNPILGLLIEDEYRNILNVNQAFCQMFSIPAPPAALIGINCEQSAEQSKHLFKDPEAFVERVNELLLLRQAAVNEILEMQDGRYFKRDYLPVYIDNQHKGHLWVYVDITEVKTVELKLQEQRNFYEKILNDVPAAIAVFDNNHNYVFANPLAIQDEHLRKWIIGKTDFDYCAYRNKDFSIAQRRKVIFNEMRISGRQRSMEEHLVDQQGNDRYFMRFWHPTYRDNGDLDMVIGYGVEITERKKIELQVAQSEMRFRGMFEKSPALITIHNLEGTLIDINQTALDILGYDKEDLLGKNIGQFIIAQMNNEADSNINNSFELCDEEEGIKVIKTKTGKDVHVLFRKHQVTFSEDETYILVFAQDITARINAEQELKKSEEKYKAIIENMNLGLIEVDQNGRIIFTNARFNEMIGFKQKELIGENVKEIYQVLNPTFDLEEILTRRELGISESYECSITDKAGNQKWVLISGGPVFGPDGAFKGSVGIYLEITQQKHLEAELRKAKATAENSSQAKEMFLASMSHEIRTPLNVIINIGGLLEKTPIDGQQMFYLSTLKTAAQNLLVIINDLLDFSKIESGNLTFEHIPFSITDLLTKARQVLLYKAEEKGIPIDLEIDPSIANCHMGDPYRLNQIVLNILGNAIKFTEKGLISIRCSVKEQDQLMQVICISIKDTGVGISKDFLNDLFDKFSQEDKSITRKYGGTGLGMSISKDLVERMGGSLAVESEKNVGSTFFINLKLFIADNSIIQAEDDQLLDISILKGKRILLAEDNEMNRLLAHTLLGYYDILVDEAEDGKIAIDMLKNSKYDLVLMDVQMPEMDGLKATEFIRQKLGIKIPIIALTAHAFKEEQNRCLAAGMDDFISKPFDVHELIQLIARWIKKSTK